MKLHVVWVILIAAVAGAGGSFAGFKIAQANSQPKPEPEKTAEIKAPVKVAVAAEANNERKFEAPKLTDEDIENLIAEVKEENPDFDEEQAKRWQERSNRWANFTTDQRRVWRKAFFSALADVEGLEEIEEGIKEGKLDPEKFRVRNMEDIADRMEFYTETMDEAAINTEMTKTLEGFVSEARAQMVE